MINQTKGRKFSFSGIVFGWLLLTLLFGSFFYFFIITFFPYSDPNLSNQQVFILRSVWLIWIPFLTFPFLLSLLPFEPIDFSLKAIFKTFTQKIFFICTSPIILVGYYIAKGFVNSSQEIMLSGLGFIYYWIFVWPFIFLWLIISLWLWVLIFGRDSSNTIIIYRNRKIQKNQKDKLDPYYVSSSSSPDKIFHSILKNEYQTPQDHTAALISRRWLSLSISSTFLLVMLAGIVDPFGNFDFALIASFSFDSFIFLISLSFYKKVLANKHIKLNFIDKVNTIFFGQQDISYNAMGSGILSFFIITPFFIVFIRIYPLATIFILFPLSFLIIIVMIWNNQFKEFFSKLRV